MCNAANCAHLDPLDDRLDDFLADFGLEAAPLKAAELKSATVAAPVVHVEACRKCGGSGDFRGYTGRVLGPCHACKGRGRLQFKTSAAQRAKGRQGAHARRERDQAAIAAQAQAWRAGNPKTAAWLDARAGRFDFAASMRDALTRYGTLTGNQAAAVARCMLRDEERDAERAAAQAAKEAAAPTVDVSVIERTFAVAKGNGVASPTLRLDTFKFKPAPAHGNNAGAIYVTEDGLYLGKIQGGKFHGRRECDAATEARIVTAASNPSEAATAYGQRFGKCSVCGRTLTKGESIDRAIGPICADKYGF